MVMVLVTCWRRWRRAARVMHRAVWRRASVVRVLSVCAGQNGSRRRERELYGHRHQGGNCQEPAMGNHRDRPVDHTRVFDEAAYLPSDYSLNNIGDEKYADRGYDRRFMPGPARQILFSPVFSF